MNIIANAMTKKANKTTTTNGMPALKSTMDTVLDLFYKIGGARGQDMTSLMLSAYNENKSLATRVMMNARDVRNGKGERKHLRDFLLMLELNDPVMLHKLIPFIPEVGRWDDILIFKTRKAKDIAYSAIKKAILADHSGLAAKWAPRKGDIAVELTRKFGMTPRQYRKTLVALTNVVETQMCNKQWPKINYSHVPSIAFSRYKKAFAKHDEARFAAFVGAANSGEAKINAGAIFPHDVIAPIWRSIINSGCIASIDRLELAAAEAQWKNLPDYVGDQNILCMPDVSGSMLSPIAGSAKVTCIQVGLALSVYFAQRNTGPFAGKMISFTDSAKILDISGKDILSSFKTVLDEGVGYSTNVMAAHQALINLAVKTKASQDQMPKALLMFSDMQFNSGNIRGKTAYKKIVNLYAQHGYEAPQLIFWNLNGIANVPATSEEEGAYLLSGFSASAFTGAMEAMKNGECTPVGAMLQTIMRPEYDFVDFE